MSNIFLLVVGSVSLWAFQSYPEMPPGYNYNPCITIYYTSSHNNPVCNTINTILHTILVLIETLHIIQLTQYYITFQFSQLTCMQYKLYIITSYIKYIEVFKRGGTSNTWQIQARLSLDSCEILGNLLSQESCIIWSGVEYTPKVLLQPHQEHEVIAIKGASSHCRWHLLSSINIAKIHLFTRDHQG